MGVEVDVMDSGATGLAARIGALAQDIVFGVLEDAEDYPDGTPVAVVASVHEFGTETNEERAMLRGYVDAGGRAEIADAGQDQIGKVIDGAAPASVATAVGDVAVAGVVKRIEGGLGSPLEDGSGRTPLVDTRHLLDSIAWEVAK